MSTTPCPQNKPCNCLLPKSSVAVKTKPVCPVIGGNCLILCTDILPCELAVGPCGQSGTFDFTTLNHNLDGCGSPVRWSIEDYDRDKFVDVTINRLTGILTWITQGPNTAGTYGDVCIKAECVEDCNDCGKLADVVNFSIGIKDLCLISDCEDCETCDPCTAECVDNDTNLLTQVNMTKSNIEVNGE